jgi:hypothetical protein
MNSFINPKKKAIELIKAKLSKDELTATFRWIQNLKNLTKDFQK